MSGLLAQHVATAHAQGDAGQVFGERADAGVQREFAQGGVVFPGVGGGRDSGAELLVGVALRGEGLLGRGPEAGYLGGGEQVRQVGEPALAEVVSASPCCAGRVR